MVLVPIWFFLVISEASPFYLTHGLKPHGCFWQLHRASVRSSARWEVQVGRRTSEGTVRFTRALFPTADFRAGFRQCDVLGLGACLRCGPVAGVQESPFLGAPLQHGVLLCTLVEESLQPVGLQPVGHRHGQAQQHAKQSCGQGQRVSCHSDSDASSLRASSNSRGGLGPDPEQPGHAGLGSHD